MKDFCSIPRNYISFLLFFFFREELFDNPDSGASPDATKVLLLITDGNPSDSDRLGIIEKYEIKHIIRFVVMVSCAASCFFKLFDLFSQLL